MASSAQPNFGLLQPTPYVDPDKHAQAAIETQNLAAVRDANQERAKQDALKTQEDNNTLLVQKQLNDAISANTKQNPDGSYSVNHAGIAAAMTANGQGLTGQKYLSGAIDLNNKQIENQQKQLDYHAQLTGSALGDTPIDFSKPVAPADLAAAQERWNGVRAQLIASHPEEAAALPTAYDANLQNYLLQQRQQGLSALQQLTNARQVHDDATRQLLLGAQTQNAQNEATLTGLNVAARTMPESTDTPEARAVVPQGPPNPDTGGVGGDARVGGVSTEDQQNWDNYRAGLPDNIKRMIPAVPTASARAYAQRLTGKLEDQVTLTDQTAKFFGLQPGDHVPSGTFKTVMEEATKQRPNPTEAGLAAQVARGQSADATPDEKAAGLAADAALNRLDQSKMAARTPRDTSAADERRGKDSAINAAFNDSGQDWAKVLENVHAGKYPQFTSEIADHAEKMSKLSPDVQRKVAAADTTVQQVNSAIQAIDEFTKSHPDLVGTMTEHPINALKRAVETKTGGEPSDIGPVDSILETAAALQPGQHNFRSIGALTEFKKALGIDPRTGKADGSRAWLQNPGKAKQALQSIADFNQRLKDNSLKTAGRTVASEIPSLPPTLAASDVGKVYKSPVTGKSMKITAVNPDNPKQFKSIEQ